MKHNSISPHILVELEPPQVDVPSFSLLVLLGGVCFFSSFSNLQQMHLEIVGFYLRGDGTYMVTERCFTDTACVGKISYG